MKYYVVRIWKKTWIFSSWNEVLPLVSGFPHARYKSFPSKELAQEAFLSWREPYYQTQSKKYLWKEMNLPFEKNSIAVDAACSGNPGKLEYRGVDLQTWEELFHQCFDLWTNNIGEFLALVHGMTYLQTTKQKKAIYSDSKIAMSWARQGICKSLLKQKHPELVIWKVVEKAEQWLKDNKIPYELLKWKTEDWGEIPADFWRK